MSAKCNSAILCVEAKKPYRTKELHELILSKGNYDRVQTKPYLKKSVGYTSIVFPGVDGFENLVSASKSEIYILRQKAKAGETNNTPDITTLGDGWDACLHLEDGLSGNLDVMKAIATEIKRLVG